MAHQHDPLCQPGIKEEGDGTIAIGHHTAKKTRLLKAETTIRLAIEVDDSSPFISPVGDGRGILSAFEPLLRRAIAQLLIDTKPVEGMTISGLGIDRFESPNGYFDERGKHIPSLEQLIDETLKGIEKTLKTKAAAERRN